jgi:hypothetical protein
MSDLEFTIRPVRPNDVIQNRIDRVGFLHYNLVAFLCRRFLLANGVLGEAAGSR